MSLALVVSRAILQFPADGLISKATVDDLKGISEVVRNFLEEPEDDYRFPDYDDKIELWQDSTILPGTFYLIDLDQATETEWVH